MTIPALPALDRTSPTFRTDVDKFFATQLPAFTAALDPEIERLNALGYGSYNATSTTSLVIGTGSKSLTVESGKGYVAGQVVMLASTASPSDYMAGRVTSYSIGSGALVVNVTSTGGSGTVAAWTVSVSAGFAEGGYPVSIVVLTSGTSWTCPAGVTKAVITVVGGCGGGGGLCTTYGYTGGAGGGGGAARSVIPLSSGTSYSYVIGAGGTAGTNGTYPIAGNAGGTSTWGTLSATGGRGGEASTSPFNLGGAGGSASGGQLNVAGGNGESGHGTNMAFCSGMSGFGLSRGGSSGNVSGYTSGAGDAGRIILELYK